jgi:hypothetical protein
MRRSHCGGFTMGPQQRKGEALGGRRAGCEFTCGSSLSTIDFT